MFHGEAVLIEASCDSEDISLKLFAETIGFDLLAHSAVEEDPALVIVIDFKGFGGSLGGVGHTELNYERRNTFIDDHKK